MKQSDSNSFQRALAEGDASAHPDADVLTAFAEEALLPRERETVLAHLAGCAECRQVLAFASDGAERPAQTLKPFVVSHQRRLAVRVVIPTLAAAAVIAVVSTVAVRYQLKKEPQGVAVATKRAEVKPNSPADARPSQPEPEKRAARKAAHSLAAPTPQMQAGPPPMAAGEVSGDASFQSKKLEAVPKSTIGQLEMQRLETARAAAPATAFENAAASRGPAAASSSLIAPPHWRINDQGQPERAFGDGTWHAVSPNQSAKMQVVSVLGGEVWVGGENSQAFRSLDNGTTWRVVSLPPKSGISHTIAHIRFDSAQAISIEAADGTTWISTDGGESWK